MKNTIMNILMDLAKAFYCGDLLRHGIPANTVTEEWRRIDEHNKREALRWSEI